VYAGDAAYLAARTGLQVHGAIGYTAEFDLSLWLNRIRALHTAWGTPAYHRSRVLEHLVSVGA
jgi:alkylation response protein AidB-like acyl-CoA dehydrogenase